MAERRVATINRSCVSRFGTPFVERGVNARSGALLHVDFGQTTMTLEPLFGHLRQLPAGAAVTEDVRSRTNRHLQTLLVHHGLDAGKAITIENNMASVAKVNEARDQCVSWKFLRDLFSLFRR